MTALGIVASGVRRSFGAVQAVRDVNLEARAGAVTGMRLSPLFSAHGPTRAGEDIAAAAALAGVRPSNPQWFDWSQLPAQALLVQAYGVPGGVGWNAPT